MKRGIGRWLSWDGGVEQGFGRGRGVGGGLDSEAFTIAVISFHAVLETFFVVGVALEQGVASECAHGNPPG